MTTAVRDELRVKALAYLRGGNVTILHAQEAEPVPMRVTATVQGHRAMYWVDLIAEHWSCQCQRFASDLNCPHITAVQIVTGHYKSGGEL